MLLLLVASCFHASNAIELIEDAPLGSIVDFIPISHGRQLTDGPRQVEASIALLIPANLRVVRLHDGREHLCNVTIAKLRRYVLAELGKLALKLFVEALGLTDDIGLVQDLDQQRVEASIIFGQRSE